MADITMCTQSFCPDWGICYRAQATPSHMQSMAAFEYSVVDGVAHCESYIPIYQEANMATRDEIQKIRERLKADRKALDDAKEAIENALLTLREADIIIDDMADEIADLSSDAPLCIKCGSVTVTGEPTWKAEAREDA